VEERVVKESEEEEGARRSEIGVEKR